MMKKPQNPLVAFVSVLGILSGISSIMALLIYPQENYWPVLFFLTVIFFALVKLIKYLLH